MNDVVVVVVVVVVSSNHNNDLRTSYIFIHLADCIPHGPGS